MNQHRVGMLTASHAIRSRKTATANGLSTDSAIASDQKSIRTPSISTIGKPTTLANSYRASAHRSNPEYICPDSESDQRWTSSSPSESDVEITGEIQDQIHQIPYLTRSERIIAA